MRLLLVEDDAVFSATLARALQRLGHGVDAATEAETAAAALRAALADQAPIDAAIVDLRLGEQSGLAVIDALLAIDPELRILMLTGFASIATAIDAIKRGAFNYLPKPAKAAEILAALEPSVAEPAAPAREPSLRRREWEHIQRALADHDYNISATARALGMHRRTLQRKLAKKPVRE